MKFNKSNGTRIHFSLQTTAIMIFAGLLVFSSAAMAAEIKVDASKVIRQLDRHKILGNNIALWNSASTFKNPAIIKMFKDITPGLIRIPGGGASDGFFWNGNGVRLGNNIPNSLDVSKYVVDPVMSYWKIDYSDWAPGFFGFSGFPKDPSKATYNQWHGNCDVKDMFEFIKNIGSSAYVTVNVGTGTARDAAEWVKWANKKMGYNAKYWEIGNEIQGSWENGHIRPDGKEITGKVYAQLFKDFATEMKKVDPTIKVRAQIDQYWVKDLMEGAGDLVDFISYHDYYNNGKVPVEQMWATLTNTKRTINEIRSIVKKTRPDRADKVEIGISEYNSQLLEDVWTANLYSGIFVIAAMGEMMKYGMDIATLWDSFTQKKETGGGHGFILEEEGIPKAEYWSFMMYHKYFGDTLLAETVDDNRLQVYASKNDDGEIFLMVVNKSETNNIKTTIKIDKAQVSSSAEYERFSCLEYRWEPAKFTPTINFGPTELKYTAGNSFEFTFPAFSAVVFKLNPKKNMRTYKLAVMGTEETVVATGKQAELEILALDYKSEPLKDAPINVSAGKSKIKLSKSEYRTDANGKARVQLSAPAVPEKAELKIVLNPQAQQNELTINHTVIVTEPRIEMVVPKELPLNKSQKVDIMALWGDGRPLESFNDSFKLQGFEQEISGKFKNGLATVSIAPSKSGTYPLKVVTDAGISSAVMEVKAFEEEDVEKIILQFNNDADMAHVKGKGNFKIDYNIRANQGVFSINVDGFSGWKQDFWDMYNFDQIKDVNWTKVFAVTLEYMIPESFDAGNQWASMVFVLQAFGSWWMPLKEIPLSGVQKGKWMKLILPIEKPEWRDSMKSFTTIIVVFNSGGPIKGNVYIDNIGFMERVAK